MLEFFNDNHPFGRVWYRWDYQVIVRGIFKAVYLEPRLNLENT